MPFSIALLLSLKKAGLHVRVLLNTTYTLLPSPSRAHKNGRLEYSSRPFLCALAPYVIFPNLPSPVFNSS